MRQVPISPQAIYKALQSEDKDHGPGDFPEIDWPEPVIVKPPWEGGDGRDERKKDSYVARMARPEGGRGSETAKG